MPNVVRCIHDPRPCFQIPFWTQFFQSTPWHTDLVATDFNSQQPLWQSPWTLACSLHTSGLSLLSSQLSLLSSALTSTLQGIQFNVAYTNVTESWVTRVHSYGSFCYSLSSYQCDLSSSFCSRLVIDIPVCRSPEPLIFTSRFVPVCHPSCSGHDSAPQYIVLESGECPFDSQTLLPHFAVLRLLHWELPADVQHWIVLPSTTWDRMAPSPLCQFATQKEKLAERSKGSLQRATLTLTKAC